MEVVGHILSIAKTLYDLCGKVSVNQQQCQRLASRVRVLEEIVQTLVAQGLEMNKRVLQDLKELEITLETAGKVVKKHNSLPENYVKRMMKADSYKGEFETLNTRLNDHFQQLSLGLQLEQTASLGKVFKEARRREEDEADRKKDLEVLITVVRTLGEKIDEMDGKKNLQDMHQIKMEELEFDYPKTPIRKTDTHDLYKGKYNTFTVAIKRYTCSQTTHPSEVRTIFQREVDTLKRFQSPNILRMFGICVEDDKGPSPIYLIVTEFCEKGVLPEVLAGKYKLSWGRRVRMSLDAAQGLYRIHHSEEFRLYGCISSNKFLVDDGYRVKLGCYELVRTEMSLKRNLMRGKGIAVYCCPQHQNNMNYPYSKASEIYSFGIVLWEIATRKIPFKGMSDKDIHVKVCQEKFTEPLPEDCPKSLAKLIDDCRSFDPFNRPKAGVLVDQLKKIVEDLDDE
ncbi:hypothetical protein COCON_G00218860 [Conger conger]|uniref:Protein kinase domain-containing protein n=1 Tax=Conger conger TaxID=82655 RepID=A0A9Q1HNV4_CONCO|nr:mixed lineage kinase domain-like protein [Conger conger]KAJ8252574.1 hypothetical protein COCON_G00218860 [Conger conger]